MNSQLKEVLFYQGQEVAVDCDPLNQYFSQLKSPPRFLTTCRANERGYLGKWVITKDELYLTELIGILENNDEISLQHIFPGKQVVFAEWFTGEIIINKGKLLALKTMNHPAIYEKDLHLGFVNGRLISTEVCENKLEQISMDIHSGLSGSIHSQTM
jgi:hypothetical protein